MLAVGVAMCVSANAQQGVPDDGECAK